MFDVEILTDMIKTDQKKNQSLDLQYQVPSYHIPIDKFFQFGLSIDCMVFGYEQGSLKVLLIERGVQPYSGAKALPGDLVYPNEEIEVAAQRILSDLTGLDNVFLKQTKTYGKVDRHPIGRVVTIGYYSLIDISRYDPQPFTWATNVFWKDVADIPSLAFDHNQILQDGLTALRREVKRRPVGFELLPEKFTLGELQALYEALLNERYDKANFRKRFLSMNLLHSLKESQTDVPHRPGRLYSFDQSRYEELKTKGFSFEFK